MEIIEKDLLTVEAGVICHQVNCQGVMGSGVALAIRNKWFQVYRDYMAMCSGAKPEDLLGRHHSVIVGPDPLARPATLFVCNVFGQLDYNRSGTTQRVHTNYGAIQQAFTAIGKDVAHLAYEGVFDKVYVPYLMGCDRGGGVWSIVEQIIDSVCPGVIACKLPS